MGRPHASQIALPLARHLLFLSTTSPAEECDTHLKKLNHVGLLNILRNYRNLFGWATTACMLGWPRWVSNCGWAWPGCLLTMACSKVLYIIFCLKKCTCLLSLLIFFWSNHIIEGLHIHNTSVLAGCCHRWFFFGPITQQKSCKSTILVVWTKMCKPFI